MVFGILSMCMCIYIYICVCLYMYVRACIHTHLHTHTHIYIVYVYIQTHIWNHMHTHGASVLHAMCHTLFAICYMLYVMMHYDMFEVDSCMYAYRYHVISYFFMSDHIIPYQIRSDSAYIMCIYVYRRMHIIKTIDKQFTA